MPVAPITIIPSASVAALRRRSPPVMSKLATSTMIYAARREHTTAENAGGQVPARWVTRNVRNAHEAVHHPVENARGHEPIKSAITMTPGINDRS
jgi:hypothetical protein